MDALAVAAEVAAVLQAAETMPVPPRRRVPRKERQEAYLAYQRETFRLVAAIIHLSVVGQTKTTSWRYVALIAISMAGPVVNFLTGPAEKKSFSQSTQELLSFITEASKELSPVMRNILASEYDSNFALRDRMLSEVGVVRDVSGDYLAAQAKVYLVGRPNSVEAANVMRDLVKILANRTPARENRTVDNIFSRRAEKKLSSQIKEFNKCLAAIDKANSQFTWTIRLDQTRQWKLWRRRLPRVKSASELLTSEE